MNGTTSRRRLLQTAGAGAGGLLVGEFGLTPGRSDLYGGDRADSDPDPDAGARVPPVVSAWETRLDTAYAYATDSEDGVVAVTRYDGRVTALDRGTGTVLGTVPTGRDGWPSPRVEAGVVYDRSASRLSVVDGAASTSWARAHPFGADASVHVTEDLLYLVADAGVRAYERATGREAFEHAPDGGDVDVDVDPRTLTVTSDRRNVVLDPESGTTLYEAAAASDEDFAVRAPESREAIHVYDGERLLELDAGGDVVWERSVPDASLVATSAAYFALVRQAGTPSERTVELVDGATGESELRVAAGTASEVSGAGVVYADGRTLGRLDVERGTVAWERELPGPVDALALQRNYVFVPEPERPERRVAVQYGSGETATLALHEQRSGDRVWAIEPDEPLRELAVPAGVDTDATYLAGEGRLLRVTDDGAGTPAVSTIPVLSTDDVYIDEVGPYVYVESDVELTVTDRSGAVQQRFAGGDVVSHEGTGPAVVETVGGVVGYDPGSGVQWRRDDIGMADVGVDSHGQWVVLRSTDGERVRALERSTGRTRVDVEGPSEYVYGGDDAAPSSVLTVRDGTTLHVLTERDHATLEFESAPRPADAALADGTLLVPTKSTVVGFDAVSLSERWRAPIPDDGTVDVVDDRCYLAGDPLRCLRVRDGQALWLRRASDGDGYVEATELDGVFLGGSAGIARVAPPAGQVTATLDDCRRLRRRVAETPFQVPATADLARARDARKTGRLTDSQAALGAAYADLSRATAVLERWRDLRSGGVAASLVGFDGSLDAAERAMRDGDYGVAAANLADVREARDDLGLVTVLGTGVLAAAVGYVLAPGEDGGDTGDDGDSDGSGPADADAGGSAPAADASGTDDADGGTDRGDEAA